MLRRPPRSTLFPTRRSSDLPLLRALRRERWNLKTSRTSRLQESRIGIIRACMRSEEHTSELQSHVNLVCRLLLEKKKNTKNINHFDQPHIGDQHVDQVQIDS